MTAFRHRTSVYLPRLQPATFGAFPAGPFAHRWFGPVKVDSLKPIDVIVSSTRPVHGVSTHLVADRWGDWVAYTHTLATGARRRVGNSAMSESLARTWGVL